MQRDTMSITSAPLARTSSDEEALEMIIGTWDYRQTALAEPDDYTPPARVSFIVEQPDGTDIGFTCSYRTGEAYAEIIRRIKRLSVERGMSQWDRNVLINEINTIWVKKRHRFTNVVPDCEIRRMRLFIQHHIPLQDSRPNCNSES